MLNIAFDDANLIYRQGMETLLNQLPLEGSYGGIEYQSLTKNNVEVADIVVKSFVPGEEHLCIPIFKFRTKPGLIIGLCEGGKTPTYSHLPLCISQIIFVHRSDSVSTTSERLVQAWNKRHSFRSHQSCMKCLKCKYRTLTSQQYSIIKHMLNDKDIKDIADLLDIHPKTVSTHKRMIMNKFNLTSDFEMLQLFNKYKTQLLLASSI